MNLALQKPASSFSFTPSTKSFIERHQNGIKFGASTSDNFEDIILNHAEQDFEAGVTGWIAGKALSSGISSNKDYQKLDKYRKLPPQITYGEYCLNQAKSSQNPKIECKLAEDAFLSATRSTDVNVHRARASRMAAIAAKLRGEGAAARSYMNFSKDFLLKSGPYALSDRGHMSEECNFLANKIAEPVKRVLFAPVRLVEGVARAAADILTDDHLVDEEHYLTTKLTSPFQVALNETEDELKFHYKILDNGELSDDEWIDGKDRVKLGTSTGNGLRHRYRDIETAEEKRIEAQRKAAEDARRAEEAKQAAEAAKRAETQRKADAQRRSAEQARKDAECCQKTSFGIVAVIAMLWGLAALGKQD